MDQAEGLRHMRPPVATVPALPVASAAPLLPVQVVAVTSGKGGVGKTSVSVNLAVSMAQSGRKVMLLDGDLGLANCDVMLGLQPSYNLADVIDGKCSLEETMIEGPAGLVVVPASSGRRNMSELKPLEHAGLVHAFSELSRPLDVMVIDTAAGISDSVVTFAQAAQQVIVVLCNDPSSMTDAYALIKVLYRDYGVKRFQVLANMVGSPAESKEIVDNLRRVAERFLDVTLTHMGAVPQDEWLKRAVRRQRAVVDAYPNSPSSAAFGELSRKVAAWGMPPGARGNLEFFVERMVAQPNRAAAVSA
ncbi:MAG: MinD/ParA family protein [Panacagrimonas sp.]